MIAIDAMKADLGTTLILGLVMSIPIAVVAGPLFTYWIAPRATSAPPMELVGQLTRHDDRFRAPSIAATILTILFPILLMLGKAAADLALPAAHPVHRLFEFFGNPIVALLLAVILSMFTFGFSLGKDTRTVGKLLGDALPPISAIILIIGAGGALKQTLIDVGLGAAIAHASPVGANSIRFCCRASSPTVILPVATGSATVAIVSFLRPDGGDRVGQSESQHFPDGLVDQATIVIFFSHINDARFWLVKEYVGADRCLTKNRWSQYVLETILAVVGLFLYLGLSLWWLISAAQQTFIKVARSAVEWPKVTASLLNLFGADLKAHRHFMNGRRRAPSGRGRRHARSPHRWCRRQKHRHPRSKAWHRRWSGPAGPSLALVRDAGEHHSGSHSRCRNKAPSGRAFIGIGP